MQTRSRCGGYTYVGLIVVVAVIGLAAAMTVKLGALQQRRAAEQQLLEVGAAYAAALQRYAAATPPGQRKQPAALQDLLRDPRFVEPHRYLRKRYADPITASQDWGLLLAPDGIGIVGVYSKSPQAPIKIANFDARFQGFEGRQHLNDWKFIAEASAAH